MLRSAPPQPLAKSEPLAVPLIHTESVYVPFGRFGNLLIEGRGARELPCEVTRVVVGDIGTPDVLQPAGGLVATRSASKLGLSA